MVNPGIPLSASTSRAALSTRRRACSPRRRGRGCGASGSGREGDGELAPPGEGLSVTLFLSLDRDAIVSVTYRDGAVSMCDAGDPDPVPGNATIAQPAIQRTPT